MDWTLTRNERRAIRIFGAIVGGVAAGSIVLPAYMPSEWQEIAKETATWIVSIFVVLNPFLDLGATDAKADIPRIDLPKQ